MELSLEDGFDAAVNPLDSLEALLAEQDWSHDRVGEDELHVAVQGHWCTYHLTFSWHEGLESLHLACSFDMRVAHEKRSELTTLLALINEQLWIGHFDVWSDDGMVIFRHGMMLHGGAELTLQQCEGLIRMPVDACERFYPAFQFVVWAGKSAVDAMQSAMFETVGRA